MKIQKRRPECKTIEEVVLSNVGMTKEEFLIPKSKYHIDGITESASLLNVAGYHDETITIVGDYDADGICASSILSLVFREKGWKHIVRLPKRFTEGYGLSEAIIDEIDSGLLITVDNGIAASEEIKKAKEKGLTVIVTDHHLPDADCNIPDADVVIDPNAIAGTADFNSYCGAGIAFKLAIAILGENHPLIPKLRTLAAIATVADVMPLIEENRFIVKDGLAGMLTKNGKTAGLAAILAECKQEKYFSAKNVAFKLGPMINAPGRMQDDGAEISFDILTFEGSASTAMEKASYLSDMNEKRKVAKKEGLELLHKNMTDNCLYGDCPLVIYEPNLPEGLVGIFAGQLAEEFKVPCFVLTDGDEDGIAKGSGRTYGDINIKELLDRHQDLMVKYGGHSEAAGISVSMDKIDEFKYTLIEDVQEHYTFTEDDTIYYDLKIDAKMIDTALNNLETFEPFGQGNPEIVFYIENFVIAEAKYLQEGESVRCRSGNGSAVCFGMGKEYRDMGEPKVVNLVGTLSKNCFMSNITNQVEVTKIIKPSSVKTMTPMAEMLAKMAAERNS